MGQVPDGSPALPSGYLTLVGYERPRRRRRRRRRARQALTYAVLALGAAYGALLLLREVAPPF